MGHTQVQTGALLFICGMLVFIAFMLCVIYFKMKD